jgi:hypothetical protein
MIFQAWAAAGGEIAKSWALIELVALQDALEQASGAAARHESLGAPKFEWRAHLAATEALVELGRPTEAQAELPPPSPGDDLQDIAQTRPPRASRARARAFRRALELGRRVAARPTPC